MHITALTNRVNKLKAHYNSCSFIVNTCGKDNTQPKNRTSSVNQLPNSFKASIQTAVQ